jgi:uncharacterized protein with HEPN domain
MKGPLSDKIRLMHILDAIGEVEKYLGDITYEDHLASSETHFASKHTTWGMFESTIRAPIFVSEARGK